MLGKAGAWDGHGVLRALVTEMDERYMALLAAAELLAVPDALAGRPGVLVLLLAAGGLVRLRNWHRWRRPLIRWPRPPIRRAPRRGVVRGRW